MDSFCELGESCIIGPNCTLGDACHIGNECFVGDGCALGEECYLSSSCRLGDHCSLEAGRIKDADYIAIDHVDSLHTRIYCLFSQSSGEIFVRMGPFFGSLDEYVEFAHNWYASNSPEAVLLAVADFARAVFDARR